MIRWTVAGLIVVGLLVGIWMVWPSNGSAPTTVPEAAETTTSERPTTTTSASTTTTLDPLTMRDVESVEQAEAILRELWFGWFEGIYNQDEDRIREVVATEEQLTVGKEAFGASFTEPPTREGVVFASIDVLRSDDECLVAFVSLDVTDFRGAGSTTDFVSVQRFVDGRWLLMSTWQQRGDLWEADCDAVLQQSS